MSDPAPANLGAGLVLLAPIGSLSGDQFGNSVAPAGDVNGDGYADFVVGAWASDVLGEDQGSASVYFGGPFTDDVADVTFYGTSAGDNFGTSVATAGDVNGDGYSDIIVGAYRSSSATLTGRAYVFYGGSSVDTTPDLVLLGAAFDDRFGLSVSSAGDLNGDGFSDVIVGAPSNDSGGSNAGRAYIYLGGSAANTQADLLLTGAAAGDAFGYAVSPAGDLNADGFDDVVVGAYGSGGMGRAYVYYGGPGLDVNADLTLTGEAEGDNFGLALASAGDVNGDGQVDLAIGAVRSDVAGLDAGRVYLYHGGSLLDAVADGVLDGAAALDNFGVSLSAAGDMNGDGRGDLIVGAWLNDAVGSNAGRAYVYFMGPGADAIADLVLSGEAPGDRLGVSVAGAGDVNSDGAADVIIGAYFNDVAGPEAGRAYIVTRGQGHAPVVTAPSTVTGNVGALISFMVTASDPDGDPIAVFSAAPLPAGATFTANGSRSSGTFAWTPASGQAGSYEVTFTASNDRTGSASTSITVSTLDPGNEAPSLAVPAGVFGSEGVLISFGITATDPDGDHVTLGALNRPVGSLFVDYGNNTGAFNWTPGFGQMGTYTITFTGRDDPGLDAAPRDLTIVVDDVNRAPTAVPGGPYAGVVNVPILFNGTASSDPDGSPLTYIWGFGDQTAASGATPLHPYTSGGTFTVVLTVGDGSLSHSASTVASVQDVFPARAFTTNANGTIKLGAGKETWCAEIEPVDGAFLITSVIPATLAMKYETGLILAMSEKVAIGSDRDGNGIQELAACFAKADLRTLFAALPKGTSTVTVTLEGDLRTGGKFRTTLTVDVSSKGGTLAASLSPNPLNPAGTLSFSTSRAGRVSVTIYDLHGRLVRSLARDEHLDTGYHDFRLDARGDQGQRLPSGVYFYRIDAEEGTETGRFVIAK